MEESRLSGNIQNALLCTLRVIGFYRSSGFDVKPFVKILLVFFNCFSSNQNAFFPVTDFNFVQLITGHL